MDLNTHSKPYFLIQPDYEGCIGYCSIDNCSYGCDNDTIEIEGYESTPFIIPGIEEWCWEWDREMHKAKNNEPSVFNWEDWHKRGIYLAQLLRQIVSDDIEIIYRKGAEDIKLDKFKYFSLSPDTCFLIGDTNLYSIIYEEDLLEIGYFPAIHLDGLDIWWKDFDRHVEYAETWTDPNFDWMSWYECGLNFVKKIREQLPDSIEVWYRIPYELAGLLPIPDLLVKKNGTFLIRNFLLRGN